MVAGQMIDVGSLRALLDPADLVIAHNAGFDRPFCEAQAVACRLRRLVTAMVAPSRKA